MNKAVKEASRDDENLRPLLRSLRGLIQRARQQVLRAVDVVQVQVCWEIGRHIVEFEHDGVTRAEYGERLMPALAAALTGEFGKGFDATNLRSRPAGKQPPEPSQLKRPIVDATHHGYDVSPQE
jgi:DUF1016 N-terminal domain